jgi:hypothetical protein
MSLAKKIVARLQLAKGMLKFHLVGLGASRKIFVVGSGRSGTHWLGYIIGAHPDITATVEKPPIFPWATQMALRPETVGELYPKLVRRYRHEHGAVLPKHYLDKSHPCIWIAELLAESFPEALFVGIKRDVFGTVNSMLQHEGVMAWIHRWRDYPLPNRFLGLGPDAAGAYDALPIEAKCAIRWKAHVLQLERLEGVLGERLMILEYNNLHLDTATELSRISTFLDLKTPIPSPHIKTRSLDKWRHELTEAQKRNIADAVQGFPVYHAAGSGPVVGVDDHARFRRREAVAK